MKSEKGIALILLIFIVAILAIITVIGARYITEKAEEEKIEDIRTHMLSIQALVKKVKNKHIINEENALLGVKLDLENNETGYEVTEDLKNELAQIEGADLYILTQDDVNNNGLKQIEINNTEFYVVDYNSEEVYYSLGIDGNYSLDVKEEKNVETEETQTENPEIKNEGAENEGTGN